MMRHHSTQQLSRFPVASAANRIVQTPASPSEINYREQGTAPAAFHPETVGFATFGFEPSHSRKRVHKKTRRGSAPGRDLGREVLAA